MSCSFQNDIDNATIQSRTPLLRTESCRIPFRVLSETFANSPDNFSPHTNDVASPGLQELSGSIENLPEDRVLSIFTHSNAIKYLKSFQNMNDDPMPRIALRHSILATLPIPSDIPDDALKPIIIPAPFTLHEFLGNTTGVRISFLNIIYFIIIILQSLKNS